MVKRRRTSEGEKGRKEGFEKSGIGSNDGGPVKGVGCQVAAASSTSASAPVPTTGVSVPSAQGQHFTRASARKASGLENGDKAGASKTTVSTAKGQPPLLPTRCSSRVIKRPRRDGSPPPSPPKKQDCKNADGHTPDRKLADRKAAAGDRKQRGRRQWELWSVEDKQIFFGGLYEFGKDFDAIQNLFAQKHKRKGDPESLNKTKDQIRHFYYRTWNKISKYIETKDDAVVSKQALELYGLINYGELRKRIGSKLDDKNGQKLNELVQKGSTVIKVKGRTHRLKTPGCRALKKMNNVEESNKNDDNNRVKVPDCLTLDLAPHTNAAWAEVQSLAQNPRIRIKLKSDSRLSVIFDFLNRKWKPDRLRMKESMSQKEAPQQELKLHLAEKVKVFPVEMEVAPPQPRVDLGLEHYREYVLTHPALGTSPSGRKGRGGAKASGSSSRSRAKESKNSPSQLSDVLVKQESDCVDMMCSEIVTPVSMDTANVEGVAVDAKQTVQGSQDVKVSSQNKVTQEKAASDSKTSAELLHAAAATPSNAVAGGGTFSNVLNPAVAKTLSTVTTTVTGPIGLVNGLSANTSTAAELSEMPLVNNEKVYLIQGGVNRKDAAEFTIAELYLMMGSPRKMMLYYEWVEMVPVPEILQINTALTNKLRRLIHLASTEFTDFRRTKPPELISPESPHRCTCGRIQNQSTTPTLKGTSNKKVGRSPATPKGTPTIVNSMAAAGAIPRPGTPKATQTLGPDFDLNSPPSAKTVAAASSTVKPPMTDDGVFQLPVGIPIRPKPPADRQDPLSAVNRQSPADLLFPRRRRLQRNVRRPMLPVQRTLLPKMSMISANGQLGSTGSFLAGLPSQIPSPAVVSANPAALGEERSKVKPEMKRPVMRRIFPSPGGLAATNGNGLTMSPADLTKRAIIRSDLQNIIAKNVPGGIVTTGAATITTSCVATAVVGAEASSNNNAVVSGAGTSGEPPSSGTATLAVSTSGTLVASALAKSPITGEDSFLGVSPQIPTAGPGAATSASTATVNQGIVNQAMGDISLPGDSLSGLSSILDISLPAPADGDTADKFLDMSMGDNTRTTFFGILDEKSSAGTCEQRPRSPTSPSKSFKLSGEFQWPGGESGDFTSLSQLLESPAKKPAATLPASTATVATAPATATPAVYSLSHPHGAAICENSRDSILGKMDVDTTLQCMLNENSMDYVAKFADLAAQIASTASDSAGAKRPDS